MICYIAGEKIAAVVAAAAVAAVDAEIICSCYSMTEGNFVEIIALIDSVLSCIRQKMMWPRN